MSSHSEALAARLPARRSATGRRLVFNAAGALRRITGTALLEARLNLSGAAPWIIGVVLGALAYIAVRTARDHASFGLGWILSSAFGPFAALLLLFLAGSLAHRPQRYDVTELLDSKTAGSEEIIFGRWLGMLAAIAAPLLLEYGVAILAQKIHTHTPVTLFAYWQSLARVLPGVLFFATLSFCLVTLTRILILGSGLAGFAWFVLSFGMGHYPTVLRYDLSQNGGTYLYLCALTLLVMLLAYRGRRREKRSRVTAALAWAVGLAAFAAFLHLAWNVLAVPSDLTARATWDRLRDSPRKPDDPLPNFAWLDQHNRRVSIAGQRGHYALLFFFKPDDSGIVATLQRLDGLQGQLAPNGLRAIAVCASEDLGAAADAARLARVSLPVVTDWGAPGDRAHYDPERPASAVSAFIQPSGTLLVDPEGRATKMAVPLDDANLEQSRERLRARLRGEDSGDDAAPGGGLPPGIPAGMLPGMGS